MKLSTFEFTSLSSDDTTGGKTINTDVFAFHGDTGRIRDFTAGEDAHDGYPGGKPSSTEVHGSGGNDDIDHSGVAIAQEIYGFAGDDNINAGTGNDSVFGGLGDDTILANAGNDVVVGGDGDDEIYGEGGNDSIHTGDGADIVFGGSGDDFIFLTADGDEDRIYFVEGNGHDVIDGFETGIDKLALGNFGFTSFTDIEELITYSGDQALIDLGGGDSIILTGLDGPLGAGDFLI